MKNVLLIFGGLMLALNFTARASALEPSFLVGAGNANSLTFDFRLAHNFEPWLEEHDYELTPFVDGGLTWWHHGGRNGDVYGVTASAGLRLDFFLVDPIIAPYVALNAGPSLISDDEFVDRRLGGHFIFNTRATAGVRFGSNLQHDVGFNLLHYSNAYLREDNDGFNSMSVSYNYWF